MKRIIVLYLLLLSVSAQGQQTAIDSLKNSLNALEGKQKLNTLVILGNKLFVSNTVEARSYAKEALLLARELKDGTNEVAAIRVIGITYDIEGIKDSSQYYFQLAYDKSLENKNLSQQAAALNNLGMWYWNSGKYQEALSYYFKAIPLAESENNQIVLAKLFNNIGLLNQELNDYEKALEYNKKALAIRRVLNEKYGLTQSLNNIGICFKNLGQLDSARSYYIEGLSIATAIDNKITMSEINLNLGVLEMLAGNLDLALRYAETSLNDPSKIGKLLSLNTIAEIYYKKQNATQSIVYALQALDVANELNNNAHREDIYNNLTKAYILAGNREKAVEYFNKHTSLRDSIFSIESASIYNELEVNYETEKKEQQIALQNAQLEAKDLEIQRNWLFISILAVTIMAILILIALLRKREQIKRESIAQEQKIRMREAQMTAVVESQEKERKRFAADLHDGMGQLIAALQVNIQSIKSTKGVEKQDELYENSKSLLKDIHTEIRNIAFNLMPQALVKEGLISGLNELVAKVNKAGQMKVKFNHLEVPELSEVAQISLYRVIQEFLANAMKHGKADKFFIDITGHDDEIIITMEDDGPGFDKIKLEKSTGNGWRNINTRINLINAEIEIDTLEGKKGNTIVIYVPLVANKTIASKEESTNY